VRLLDNFQGILQADGYSGYGQVCRENGLTRIGCWDHARRKFVDASRAAPAKGKKGQPSKADVALSHIRKLYAVEKAGNQLSDGERYRLRQEKSLPLLNAFKAWLEKNASKVLKGSLTRKAMDYTLNQWDTLVGYCERGDLKISNAGAENAIRPFALGRNQGVITHGWVQLIQDYNPHADVGLLHRGLTWPESRRETHKVRRLIARHLIRPAPLHCVWSHQDLHRHHYAMDHCFPWSRWQNNDLWNLLPATERANAAKSDRLPAAALMEHARQDILAWWEILEAEPTLASQFRDEAQASLPLLPSGADLTQLFDSVLLQRQRLKANQQLAEWQGLAK